MGFVQSKITSNQKTLSKRHLLSGKKVVGYKTRQQMRRKRMDLLSKPRVASKGAQRPASIQSRKRPEFCLGFSAEEALKEEILRDRELRLSAPVRASSPRTNIPVSNLPKFTKEGVIMSYRVGVYLSPLCSSPISMFLFSTSL